MTKDKEKYKGYPIEIETNEILDPTTRWICQRLDKIIALLERFK